MAGFNDAPFIQRLAVPAVTVLVALLGYTSQWLFNTADDLAPGPLTARQSLVFNLLLASLWWTYYKACSVEPGRYISPDDSGAAETNPDDPDAAAPEKPNPPPSVALLPNADGSPRWCRKCAAPKPPRAHHCRHCRRCIPKMDHHCPWTGNCVSLATFPHFLRFLVYTNLSLWTLSFFLFQRFRALWDDRALPAYLGPSLPALIHLALLAIGCGVTSLALGILLGTTLKNWLFNTTSIESWEIDRHEAMVERGRSRDWWAAVDADGKRLRLEAVEYPYDLGFFDNMAQAMGSRNPLVWFFPLAGGPAVSQDGNGTGWQWQENGLNDREGLWPPPDPDKLRRSARAAGRDPEEAYTMHYATPEEARDAFRARQAADLERRRGGHRLLAELEEVDGGDDDDYDDYDMIDETYSRSAADEDEDGESDDAPEGWTNSDGERLRDYGVDEDTEAGSDTGVAHSRNNVPRPVPVYENDDEVPLGELLRRRRVVELPDDYEEDG